MVGQGSKLIILGAPEDFLMGAGHSWGLTRGKARARQCTACATGLRRLSQADQLGWQADLTRMGGFAGFQASSFRAPEGFHREAECSWGPVSLLQIEEQGQI